jgi:hypothetical protein
MASSTFALTIGLLDPAINKKLKKVYVLWRKKKTDERIYFYLNLLICIN